MMLAQAENTALELLDRIKIGYEYLPSWLKPCCEEWNKKSIKFSNRSTISGFASSSNGPRGQSMNILILDEFAFLPKSVEDKLFASVYPVISQDPNGKVILISTPNGKNNLFYKIWTQANSKDIKKNLDGWKPFQMYYWQVPGHDTPEWKATQIAAIGETKFQQEYNCQFLDSDANKKLIPDDIIEKYRMRFQDYKNRNVLQGKELPVFSKDGNKTYSFRMFFPFDKSRTYLCSSDIAEGIGKDASVLYIWDITDTSNIRMCVKFSRNDVSPLEFAYITNEICRMYANPYIACESNGIALGYIEQLRVTYGYENFVRLNRDNGCGIQSHVQMKGRACLWFREMMTTVGFGFELLDLELIEEMSTFIKKDTAVHEVYCALGDNHDDHIMTMIWACWIMNSENLEKYYNVEETFHSSLGNDYPRRIGTYIEYTQDEIRNAYGMSQVKDFMFYLENHKSEYDEYYRGQKQNQNEILELLKQNDGNQNIDVNVQYDSSSSYDNDEQMFKGTKVYTQDEMLGNMRRERHLRGQDSFIGSTGSSVKTYGSDIDSLFGFENEPMW